MSDRIFEKTDRKLRLLPSTGKDLSPESQAENYHPLTLAINRFGTTGSISNDAAILQRSPSLAQHSLLQLQQQYGNQYVQRVVELAKQGNGQTEVNPEVETAIERQRSTGHGLDKQVQGQMESAFGVDFSSVRVHTGTEADSLNQVLQARAFTTGRDIFFRRGEYNPGSYQGKELLAHELTHVVQQTGGVQNKLGLLQRECSCGSRSELTKDCSLCQEKQLLVETLQTKLRINQSGERYEQEADRVAEQVLRGGFLRPISMVSEHPQCQCLTCEAEEKDLLPRQLLKGAAELQLQSDNDENGNVTSGAQTNPCMPLLGTCEFYECMSEQTPGDRDNGYYWNYGRKYCLRFNSSSLASDPKAVRWIDCVTINLQRFILRNCVKHGNDLDAIKTCAYNSHAKVYTDCGICELDKTFLSQIQVMFTPDAADLWNREGLAQIGESLGRCFVRPFAFQAIIDQFTNWGNLDEAALGQKLADLAKASPAENYPVILGIIELLSNTFDDDDVAYEFMSALSEEDIERLAETADGRRILFLMRLALEGGVIFDEEEAEITRIGERSRR